MLKHFAEDEKYVEITGFRSVSVKDAKKFLETARKVKEESTCLQFFDADLVATWQHLYFAVLNALLAFRNQRNISKTVAMETMLYASAQRQIRKALELIGVKRDSANMAIVIIGDNPNTLKAVLSAFSKSVGAEPDEAVLELSGEKVEVICKAYGITGKELDAVVEKGDVEQAIVNLVVERMALLSTQV